MSSAATIERTTHPVADLFPMLAEDELEELAADIAERGLLQPIVLDADGRILDGRNRLAACERAGVAPEFTTYEGDDPDGYALAVNIARRHLTKGQIAMVAARARKVSLQTLRATSEAVGVSHQRVSQANAVLDHAPDLADAVVSRALSLDVAYQTAQQRKKATDSTTARMERLRADAPDLADLVVEDRMSLSEAISAAQARAAELKETLDAARSAAKRVTADLSSHAVSIILGVRAGADGLVTPELLADLRAVVDKLERC